MFAENKPSVDYSELMLNEILGEVISIMLLMRFLKIFIFLISTQGQSGPERFVIQEM